MMKSDSLPDKMLHDSVLRWLVALAWTVLVTVLLVQSSSEPVVGPAAPPGDPTLGRELMLVAGHVVAFSVLTALWWWAAQTMMPASRALFVAVVVAMVVGGLTEVAQMAVSDRSASLLDLGVNWVVAAVTARYLYRLGE